MLGLKPSDLIPWWDFNRFADLLVDGQEVVPPDALTLDANTRAKIAVANAQTDVLEALRTKQQYSLQTLKDMIRDYQLGGNYGYQLMQVIADCAWMHAQERKRYASGTPQAEDPTRKRAEDELAALKSGSRIFILEGMQMTDGNNNVIGVYTDVKSTVGLVSGHTLRSDVGRPLHLWGTSHHEPRGWFGSGDDWDW